MGQLLKLFGLLSSTLAVFLQRVASVTAHTLPVTPALCSESATPALSSQ